VLAVMLDRQPLVGLVAVLLLVVVGRLIFVGYRLVIVLVALHGAEPHERPEILRAAGDLFRVWPSRGARDGTSADESSRGEVASRGTHSERT
jgi:hypothetical protein